MDLQTSKLELIRIILNSDNVKFLNELAAFMSNERSDLWNELSAAEQAEIKKGIDQLNKGQRISYKDVLKKIS